MREQFVEPGLVDPKTLVRGSHSIDPTFIDAMVDRSLSNLRVDTIDCYYLHNPETQLLDADRETVYDRIEAAY